MTNELQADLAANIERSALFGHRLDQLASTLRDDDPMSAERRWDRSAGGARSV